MARAGSLAWADDPFNDDPTEGTEWRAMLALRADPATGAAPFKREANWDTDRDGLPDAWETGTRPRPRRRQPQRRFRPRRLHTNLEEYLNEIAAIPAGFTLGFTNATGSGRYEEIGNWTTGVWQPSRFDDVALYLGCRHRGQRSGSTRAASPSRRHRVAQPPSTSPTAGLPCRTKSPSAAATARPVRSASAAGPCLPRRSSTAAGGRSALPAANCTWASSPSTWSTAAGRSRPAGASGETSVLGDVTLSDGRPPHRVGFGRCLGPASGRRAAHPRRCPRGRHLERLHANRGWPVVDRLGRVGRGGFHVGGPTATSCRSRAARCLSPTSPSRGVGGGAARGVDRFHETPSTSLIRNS